MRRQGLKFVDVDFRALRPEWLLPNDNGPECISIPPGTQKYKDASMSLTRCDRSRVRDSRLESIRQVRLSSATYVVCPEGPPKFEVRRHLPNSAAFPFL
jgi:hypothetical protein